MQHIKIVFLVWLPLVIGAQQQIPVGNFALPVSQQPSPLFSFGQNILNQGDGEVFETFTLLRGKHKRVIVNQITALYGVNDRWSLLVTIPAPVSNKENGKTTTAFGDIFFQSEYVLWDYDSETASSELTAVGSIFLPSGILDAATFDVEADDEASTGTGSISFFLGTTFNYTTADWYFFTSYGGIITTEREGTRIGNSLFYQAGIGYNLHYFPDKILLLLIELDGIWTKKSIFADVVNPNSGGNIIFLGPSLWYSTEKLTLQVGIQAPVFQKLNGVQNKDSYFFACEAIWKFN